jgi:Phage major capsid protein E
MSLTIDQILTPQVLMDRIISRVKPAQTALSRFFGFHLGGENRSSMPGRDFWYDVVNATRTLPSPVGTTQQSQDIAPQVVGQVRGTFPRSAEKIQLLDERIRNQRVIGGNVNQLDALGAKYIDMQIDYLAQRFSNLIEFQTAAMLRGQYTYTQSGNRLYHDYTGGVVTVDYKVPSGNKNQLNINGGGDIIDASWATASTDIPYHLLQINEQSVEVNGYSITDALASPIVWKYLMNNTKVTTQGGSAQTAFEVFDKDNEGNFKGVLRCAPWLTWHIFSHGLQYGSSNTYGKVVANDQVTFCPKPSSDWCQYLDGTETVTEGPGASATRGDRSGFYSYSYPTYDPSGYNLHALHNGIPALYVPSAIINADVTP